MAKVKQNNPHVFTPTGRLAFPDLGIPKPFEEGDDPKYSTTILFPKGTDLKALQKAEKDARDKFFGAAVPKNYISPFHDGDDEDKVKLAGYAGHIYITCRTLNMPAFALANAQSWEGTPDQITKMFYGGCWARLKVQPYGYDKGKNKGVAFALCAVQFIKNAPPFGSVNTADGFEAVEVDEDPFTATEEG